MTKSTQTPSSKAAQIKRSKAKRLIRRYKGRLMLTGFLCVLFVLFFYHSMFITIYPGFKGVLFKRFLEGVVEQKVYQEGLHVLWPWNIMYEYDTRIQEMQLKAPVLTTNGLVVNLIVSVRYYPDRHELPMLHKNVGPDYAKKIVKPITMASVRNVIGKYSPEEIYSTETQIIQEEVYMEMIRRNGRIPIIYEAFLIETIILPDVVRSSIEGKLRVQQEFFTYEFRLKKAAEEIKRKMLEAESIRMYNNIVNESLDEKLLTWFGILASLKLAESNNAKVVLFGGGSDGAGGLPVILNLEGSENAKATSAHPYAQDTSGLAAYGGNQTKLSTDSNSTFRQALEDLKNHEEQFEELLNAIPVFQSLMQEFELNNLDIYSPNERK